MTLDVAQLVAAIVFLGGVIGFLYKKWDLNVQTQFKEMKERVDKLEADKEKLQIEVKKEREERELARKKLELEVQIRDIKIDRLVTAVYALAYEAKTNSVDIVSIEERNAKIDKILQKVDELHH